MYIFPWCRIPALPGSALYKSLRWDFGGENKKLEKSPVSWSTCHSYAASPGGLKTLRQKGPLSVRALATTLERDYKNVHVDTRALEEAGLLERTESGTLQAPWDIIDAHLSLVA